VTQFSNSDAASGERLPERVFAAVSSGSLANADTLLN
jgi:hypothetical protein